MGELVIKKQSSSRRVLNKVKGFFTQPANVILVVALVLLLYFNFYPFITLLIDTATVHVTEIQFSELQGLAIGSFTTFHWARLFASDMSGVLLWKPLMNSVLMSLLSSVIAIVYGGIVAFLITRTDIKGKKFISAIFVYPYIMPSWTLASFWKNFWQNPYIGSGTGGMLYNLTGICVPESFVYGLVPSAVVLGLHYAPFAYILIGGILRNMDANLEEAATILKASRMKIVRRITLPIVMPAMMSTFLLVFSSSMSAYAVPQFLQGPGSFTVLTTQMKQMINNGYYGQGYIMGLLMIIFGITILALNQYFTGRRKSFTTVSGKSGQVSYIKLKYWKWVIAVVLIAISLYCSVLPLISFALESLCVRPGDYSTLTWDYWFSKDGTGANNGLNGIFYEPQVWNAFGNSLLLALVCALIAGTCGILIGYAVARRRGTKLAKYVDNLAFLPYLMPSMALGAAFLSIGMTWGLSKTFAILIIVGSIKYLPFASRSGINAMLQLSNEIEEAALIVNVPWWKRMVRIIFPIQKSTFISGYLLPFTSCMRELSLFTLLAAGSTELLTTLLDKWTLYWPQSANALNLLIIVTVLVINMLVNLLTGASIDKGVGGK